MRVLLFIPMFSKVRNVVRFKMTCTAIIKTMPVNTEADYNKQA